MWRGVFASLLVVVVVPPAHHGVPAPLGGVRAVSSPHHANPMKHEASHADAEVRGSIGLGPPGKPGKIMMRREAQLAGLADDGQALLQEQQVLEGMDTRSDAAREAAGEPSLQVPLGLQGFPGPPGPKGKAGPQGQSIQYTSKGAASEALVADTVILQLILVLAIYCGVKRKVAALIPDSTLEDAKQVLKAAEKGRPPETYVVSGTTDPGAYDGTYRLWKDLSPDKNKSGYPVWKREGSTDYIFSTTKGTWLIGDEDEEATNFSCNTGNYGTAEKHNGAWPHEVSIGGWMFYNPTSEEWSPCSTLKITLAAP